MASSVPVIVASAAIVVGTVVLGIDLFDDEVQPAKTTASPSQVLLANVMLIRRLIVLGGFLSERAESIPTVPTASNGELHSVRESALCVGIDRLGEQVDRSIQHPPLALRQPVPPISFVQSRDNRGDLIALPTSQTGHVLLVAAGPLTSGGTVT
jgi:hypothetical protein